MEIALGHKLSDAGVIPEEWEARPLPKAARIANGQIDPRMEPYRSMVLVAPDHIESGTGRLLVRKTAREQHAISGKYVFNRGDVVYSKIRPNLRKAVLVDFDGLCSADMYPLKPARDVAGGFILAVLLDRRFTDYAESVSVRSGIPKINRAEMADFVVALPPVCEQCAIATALSDVDALLDGMDRLIAKKQDLKQAAMQQLLTGQTRLPGFKREWEAKLVGDLLAYERPDRYIVKSTAYSNHGDIPVLTANKAFILGYTTETFGVCVDLPAIVFDDFTTDSKFASVPFKVKSSAIKLLRPRHDRTSLRFLFERMQLIRFPVGEHKRHYISDFQNISLPVPKYDEQLAVVSVLSDMNAEIVALEARRDKTRHLKQAMMQELLTGKTRLVKPEAAHA